MKKIFTLLFVLYFCIELPAFAIHPDTLKLSSAANNSDSATLATPRNFTVYSLKLITTPVKEYAVRLSAPVGTSESIVPVFTGTANLPVTGSSDNLPSLRSALQLDSLRATLLEAQLMRDSVQQQVKRKYQLNVARVQQLNDVDSLRMQFKLAANDTLRALIYSRMAEIYLNYDTISNKKKQLLYQNRAIDYTLLAIHKYASYDDSTSLRKCFDNLARVYYAQKKYSQAKWFILQSNTLSRATNDIPNIISSLLVLSMVKRDIKDYSLAMSDLDEAMQLSKTSHSQKAELEVLKNYVSLYHQLKNYPKEVAMLKKQDSLKDSIRKNERAQLMAKLAAQNALQKKKADSLQNKKKLYSSNTHKLYKSGSSRKIASL